MDNDSKWWQKLTWPVGSDEIKNQSEIIKKWAALKIKIKIYKTTTKPI